MPRPKAPVTPLTPETPAANSYSEHIATRWWVDQNGTLHLGWPRIGCEDAAAAIGWVATDTATAVIEAASAGVTTKLLDTLDARFPGRRWFEGFWESPASEQDQTHHGGSTRWDSTTTNTTAPKTTAPNTGRRAA